MTPPIDEERVGIVLREMLNSAQSNARPPVTPAELRNQLTRRTLRRIDTKVVVAVAAVAAVVVTLIAVGPLRSNGGPSRSPLGNPTTTTSTPTTTTAPTTTTPTIPVAAASQLDAYVAAEASTESAAATRSGQPQPFGQPFVSDHSQPTVDGGSVVAVAAFSYDPGGHPVQILDYRGGQWSPVASLAPPPGSTNKPLTYEFLTQGPVAVADVTGDGRPDFLVEAGGADNVPGFVVSQDGGGSWRYIAFSGPYAPTPTYVIARNPRFNGNTLVTDYDNCIPNCAQGQNTTIVWTYNRSSGEFTAPNPPGA